MAFDIATAQPVQAQPGGFDISTAQPIQSQQPDFPGAAVIEPIQAVGSALGRTVVGGLAGTLQALNPFGEEGEGAKTVREFQSGAFQPTTEAGRQGLETLGALVQKGVDIANFPISGLTGLTELVTGQGLDQAVETIKSTQEKGISSTAGQRVFEETGSPLAATIAETAPTAALELLGFGPAVAGATSAVKGVTRGARVGAARAAEVGREVAPIAEAVFKVQTPTKQRIARLIEEGSTDVETARFRLDQPRQPAAAPRSRLEEFLNIGGPRVQADTKAVNAINQGFDEGVIAAVKGASDVDKDKLLKMVDIMERGKKNKLFAIRNRPSDVAGDTLTDRFNDVLAANKQSGKELNVVANRLRGQEVDSLPAVNSFIDDLDSIGVTLDANLKPNFKGSDIEGVAPAERVINQIVTRMRETRAPDGRDMHRLKRFIDEQVSFGKSGEGLTGRTEGILKNLRRNIDGILDQRFSEYDRVNTQFSETISAIDALQDVAGKKMNLTGPNAQKATGTLLRRLMSNAQSRVRLLDAVDEIEAVSSKFAPGAPRLTGVGGQKSDLLTQILFVDELDSVFGPVARTSFQGQIDQAIRGGASSIRGGAVDVAVDVAAKAAEKARGINEAGAFKSIKELLKGQR